MRTRQTSQVRPLVRRASRLQTANRVLFAAAVLSPIFLAGCASLSGFGRGDGQASADQGPGAQDIRLARAARTAGDYASAVNLYRSALAERRNDPEVLVELGDTFLDIGAIDESIEAYNQVDAKSPARFGAELGLARAELALHKPDVALGYFERADKIKPNDRKVLVGRGVTLDLLNRHADAQANYRAVLQTNPSDVAARNDLALSLAFSHDYRQALDILTPLAHSPRATPRIRQNLALIYGLEGDMQQASAESRRDLNERDTEANLAVIKSLRPGN